MTSANPDTRSQLRAEYGPWPFILVAPLDPRIIDEIREDQERYPEIFGEPIPTVLAGEFWPPQTPSPNQTPANPAPAQGIPFRLRLLIHVGNTELWRGEGTFKLQFAQRSGTCDAGFVDESYVDVTGSTAIGFYDDAVAADGWALTTNANDPTHGTDSVIAQTFEEANSFTNAVAAFGPIEDGLWDFALVDLSAPAGTAYCLRVVQADGTPLDSYGAIAEVATAP